MDKDEVIVRQGKKAIALIGNPNSGKTTLFNALSGLNQRVGNFPGVTVDRKSADLKIFGESFRLIDLPGANSLYPQASDETITTDILRDSSHPDHPDAVLVLADATQLRRGLMLCMQVLDLGFPAVLAINMMDLAEADGSHLDLDKLSKLLGIPVIGIAAIQSKGIKDLKKALPNAQKSKDTFMNIPPGFVHALKPLKESLKTTSDYLAYQTLIDPSSTPGISSEEIEKIRLGLMLEPQAFKQLVSNELLVRMDRADTFIQEVLIPPPTIRERLTERLDQWLTHSIWGYVVFLSLLLLIFQSIFVWATYPMDWIEMGVDVFKVWVADSLPAHFLTDLLTDGIITGLAGILVFIPQIAFLFFFISVLEDSGYMARVVFIMDRIMRPFGFSGRSVIPLMGGMACAIPSIMMTRSIANKKERIITTMVTPLISCSARIPVYTLLIAMFVPAEKVFGFVDLRGLIMMGMYFLGFLMALIVAWVFKTLLKHDSNNLFVMELPAYRVPGWRNVGLTVWQKSLTFVTEAGKIILAISIVLWFLVSYGPKEEMASIDQKFEERQEEVDRLDREKMGELLQAKNSEKLNASYAGIMGKWIEPVIRPLGYDWKIGISLITSFAAREVFVGTMSIIYQQDEPEGLEEMEGKDEGRLGLVEKMQREKDPDTGKPIYDLATVLSLLVFYAFAMQCVSTLAVTQKEAGWRWALFMLTYLTVIAYLAAWGTHAMVSAWL